MLLDAQLITERRLANRLSRLELARELGVSSVTIKSLEEGRNHPGLTLGFLERLGEVIGVQIENLHVSVEAEGSPAADDCKVEAAVELVGRKLAPEDVAEAFGWTLQRTHAAFKDLRRRRLGSGSQLHYSGGRYGFFPTHGLLSRNETQSLTRRHVRRTRINVEDASVLGLVLRSDEAGGCQVDPRPAQRPILQRLLRLGWVEQRDGKLHLAAEVRYCLGLSERDGCEESKAA